MKTPMSSDTKLTKDEECESVDSTKYRGMIGTTHLGLWYPKGTDIETVVYADSDHAGDYVDRKSTSGICTFVGCCLTSWFSKKQTALAISTTEAEYVSAGKACQQALWMKQALIDYDYRLSYSDEGQMFVEFFFQNQYFSFSLESFPQILRIPCEGARVFSDRWSLDELVYGAPSEGPYQTNLPSPNDIILYVREDREGQVTRIRHQEEIKVDSTIWYAITRLLDFIIGENPKLQNECYVLYDRVMNPLAAQLERKPRRDRGTRGGRHSTSSSSDFDQPSLSHLNDDGDDGNDEGTSRTSTPSPIRYVNSLTSQVSYVFQNPSNVDQNMEPFYTCQTEILNHQVQLRDEHRGGVRSIGKSLRRLLRNMKK
ncbi:hypothetical protein Tco_1466819 [Tanacetum coccineum]